MAKKKNSDDRANYRITLDRAVVCALRCRAARETLAAGKSVTWVDCLRRAAASAAAAEESTK